MLEHCYKMYCSRELSMMHYFVPPLTRYLDYASFYCYSSVVKVSNAVV